MNIVYVCAGVLGHLLIHLSDRAALKRVPLVKPVLWVVAWGLWTYSVVMSSLWPDKVTLPYWSTVLGWVLLAVSLLLALYTLFINLPFRNTYVSAGVGKRLVTGGLYALVRHPWVHWYVLLMISIILVSRSRLMLFAAPLFALLAILSAVVQDKIVFRQMFPDYASYTQEVPMLVPSRKSTDAFFSGLRRKTSAGRAGTMRNTTKKGDNSYVNVD